MIAPAVRGLGVWCLKAHAESERTLCGRWVSGHPVRAVSEPAFGQKDDRCPKCVFIRAAKSEMERRKVAA